MRILIFGAGVIGSLYAALLADAGYVITTYIVCLTGMIHPIFFVCYQITAGILLSGIVIRAFNRIKAFGVAVCLSLAMILLLFAIQDAVAWHVIPLIIIAILAELVRGIKKYNWTGDVAGTAIMSFSSFGYYGQIWFNRTFKVLSAMSAQRERSVKKIYELANRYAIDLSENDLELIASSHGKETQRQGQS